MAKRDIKIKDVGPITDITISVPDGGGMIVFKGSNGSGKSTALAALSALVTQKKDALSVRDGQLMGIVDGLGVTLTIGRNTRKRGECEVIGLTGPDPSMLVDPGFVGKDENNAARITALCTLAGAKPDPAKFLALCGDNDPMDVISPSSLEKGDVPAIAKAVKRDFERVARKHEENAESIRSKIKGLQDTIPAWFNPLTESGTDIIKEQIIVISGNIRELEGKRASAKSIMDAKASAMEAISSMGDRGTDERVKAASITLEEAKMAVLSNQREFDSARKALESAKERLDASKLELELFSEQLEMEMQSKQQRKKLQETVDRISNDDPSDFDSKIAFLRGELGELTLSLGQATKIDDLRITTDKIAQYLDQQKAALEKGNFWRNAAASCETIVMEAIAAVCPPGMSIVAGELMMATDRGIEPISDLSTGERWAIALDIASKSIPNGLLVVNQEGYESLDPQHRIEVAKMARDRGLVIATAIATDGELSVETI